MDDFEKEVITLMSNGFNQKEISNDLKKKGITPNSVSIIEKRLRALKEMHKANTLFHLALILKRKNLI